MLQFVFVKSVLVMVLASLHFSNKFNCECNTLFHIEYSMSPVVRYIDNLSYQECQRHISLLFNLVSVYTEAHWNSSQSHVPSNQSRVSFEVSLQFWIEEVGIPWEESWCWRIQPPSLPAINECIPSMSFYWSGECTPKFFTMEMWRWSFV